MNIKLLKLGIIGFFIQTHFDFREMDERQYLSYFLLTLILSYEMIVELIKFFKGINLKPKHKE